MSWSLFGGLLPIWPTIASGILVKPLYLRSMFSKSMRCTKNCNTCSWQWSTILLHDNAQTVLQKLSELGYEVLSHPPYSLDLLPTNYYFLKHLDNFLQGKHFHNQEEAENAFQEFMEFWSTDFYATWINKILVGKNVLTVMVPILINIKMYLSLLTMI